MAKERGQDDGYDRRETRTMVAVETAEQRAGWYKQGTRKIKGAHPHKKGGTSPEVNM